MNNFKDNKISGKIMLINYNNNRSMDKNGYEIETICCNIYFSRPIFTVLPSEPY